jgi:lysophospholipase L1-like esterase
MKLVAKIPIAAGFILAAVAHAELSDINTPVNQFNIGDSIGIGEAANDSIGAENRENVWTTGYEPSDGINSFNERFEQNDPTGYTANSSAVDAVYNHAVSGAKMEDFDDQARAVVASASSTSEGKAGMVTVLLGANDMCADTQELIPSKEDFEANFRAGLDELANAEETRNALVHVSGIPAIYWLWHAKNGRGLCNFVWSFGNVCQALLSGAGTGCTSNASAQDPDTIDPNDTASCNYRKNFHALIRDVYNPKLEQVVSEYRNSGKLHNAYYVDIYDVQFSDAHVNSGDCFHPSRLGHALLAETQWTRAPPNFFRVRGILQAVLPLLFD